ncbi:MAG: hypothetical protein ACK5LK_04695 [Chthoniobacterales bacterium]
MLARLRLFLKLIFRFIVFAVFAGVPFLVYYLGQVGLGEDITKQVESALSSEQYEVTVGKLLIYPVGGLVAKDLRVVDRETGRDARISQVLLDVDLSALLKKRVEVRALTLRKADLEIPLNGGRTLWCKDLEVSVLIVPGQIRISRCDFNLNGVEFSLKGSLLRPSSNESPDFQAMLPEAGAEEPREKRSVPNRLAEQALDIFNEIKFSTRPPRIEMQVSGIFGKKESIGFDKIRLRISSASWRDVRLGDIALDAAYSKGRLIIQRLQASDPVAAVSDAGGFLNPDIRKLLFSGNFDFKTQMGNANLSSSLDPVPWLTSLNQSDVLKEIILHVPPSLQVTSSFQIRDGKFTGKVIGALGMQNFVVRDVLIDELKADAIWRDGRFLLREGHIASKAANGLFDVMLNDGNWRARFEGKADPTKAQPWLDQPTRDVLVNLDLPSPASVSLEVTWPAKNSAALTGKGHITIGRVAMRKAWIDSVDTDLSIADKAVTYTNLIVHDGKSEAKGEVVYDMKRHEVRLKKVTSTVDPVKALLWIDPKISETLEPYRFKQNPRAEISGRVDMEDPDETALDIHFTAAAGLRYDLFGETLDFNRSSGSAKIRKGILNLVIDEARIYGGKAYVQARIPLNPNNPNYTAKIRLNRIDFTTLTKLYFDYDDSEGKLSGNFDYKADMRAQDDLVGVGSMKIVDGDVFAIPIFGPFSTILGEIGFQNARDATADFTVANQTITTHNLEIMGRGFSMFGEGDIYFVADKMNMNIRLNAKGLPGIVLFPISKLFEYVSYGKASDPIWRPKRIPRQILGLPSNRVDKKSEVRKASSP